MRGSGVYLLEAVFGWGVGYLTLLAYTYLPPPPRLVSYCIGRAQRAQSGAKAQVLGRGATASRAVRVSQAATGPAAAGRVASTCEGGRAVASRAKVKARVGAFSKIKNMGLSCFHEVGHRAASTKRGAMGLREPGAHRAA
ncbi:unnamed protein product [Calypogeia fissa]